MSNIGYKLSINATLEIWYENGSPEDSFFYVKELKPSSDDIPSIFSKSLSRPVENSTSLLCETWEDLLNFDYNYDESTNKWTLNITGELIVEPVNQDEGVLESTEEDAWNNLAWFDGELETIVIEQRVNGDATPESIQQSFCSGVITSSVVWYEDEEWIEDDD